MQVQKLLKLLEDPATLSSEDLSDLEALIQEYPYFYLAHALLAKAVYVHENDVEKYVVQRAATYAPDRTHLRIWLENKLALPPCTRSVRAAPTPETYTTNNYLDMVAKKSLKKSTNEISIKQFSIIDTILNKNLQFDPFVEVAPEVLSVDLSAQGTSLDERFATEALAGIMVQQKKYKRAIRMYEHLILKYPEKKEYLSDIISNLNKVL
ncbi:hypothetical protein [Candidatus Cardinium hertigii]|jgi:hypothetical protein|uniref:Tetratricopeptide repeat protein n=1 Tax=Candidatus Cardinium hertigii TaxID=247481 RepID=A0A3N2QBE0_9BACT|nr:hypothetical protein [Candidatus Cardinium hertigii]ROT47127.1 hypothetical protein EDM02_04560 [Candidatus Cardinium hertigii]